MRGRRRFSATFDTLEQAREWAAKQDLVSAQCPQPHATLSLSKEQVLAIRRPSSGFCVYFLIQGDEVIYVGQTGNPNKRIAEHLRDKQFDSYSVLPCQKGERLSLESYYIRMLRPRLNKAA